MDSIVKLITIFIFIFMLNNGHVYSQKNIAGEYSMTSIRETASGLILKEDSTFEFYFSYGALDRYGSGRWRFHDNNIILDSKPYPGKDFRLVKAHSEKNNFTTIKVDDKNKNLYSLVYCRVKKHGGDIILNADENGLIIVKEPMDSIYLLCELCSERMTSFPVIQKFNYYTFYLEPWINEIFFKSFLLHFEGDHLAGRHPLLDDKEYNFIREK